MLLIATTFAVLLRFGLAAGLLAAMVIKLPLLVLGGTAVAAGILVALMV